MDRAVIPLLRRRLCTCLPKLRTTGMAAADVRKTFLDYFTVDRDHVHVPSSPVIPERDPTLSFVNSGVTQFKSIFLGNELSSLKRVANAQKCVRIKGKHNDLSEVGLDGRHHTFFEMLGNWSFNDYFKKDACRMSWELLTKVYGLPEERLYVTYFEGDESLNLEPDLETREIWREMGVPENRILPFGMKDNFWELGLCGPCGPCTEIHYDLVEGRGDAASLVNSKSPEVIELWNLVFMQYVRERDGQLLKLNQNFVDTGMGLERLVSIVQGSKSNYETDLFYPLFEAIRKKSGHSGYTAEYNGNEMDFAYRVLADHARFLTVCLSDGMMPNLQCKVRAILRKAHSLSWRVFQVERGMLKELSNHVADILSPIYPEIGANLSKVHYIIDEEEEGILAREAAAVSNWLDLITRYPKLQKLEMINKTEFMNGFNYIKKNILIKDKGIITEEQAWTLVDTYGVPVEITQRLAAILDLGFDKTKYDEFVQSFVKLERVMQNDKVAKENEKNKDLKIILSSLNLEPTKDYFKDDYRVLENGSYVFDTLRCTIRAIIVNGQLQEMLHSDRVQKSDEILLIFDSTNLQHETIDHRSDSGILSLDNGATLNIFRVEKIGGQIVHHAVFTKESQACGFSVDSTAMLSVNSATRMGLLRSHTAAHIFNALLHESNKTLRQVSSRASVDLFTLNYATYDGKLDLEVLEKVEKNVESVIREGVKVRRNNYQVGELSKLDNLYLTLGQTFLEPQVTLVEMEGNSVKCREPCTWLQAVNTKDIQECVIIGHDKHNYRLWKITCLTGDKAKNAHLSGQEVFDRWNKMKNFELRDFESIEKVSQKIDEIDLFLKELKTIHIPLVKRKILQNDMRNVLNKWQKYSGRNIK